MTYKNSTTFFLLAIFFSFIPFTAKAYTDSPEFICPQDIECPADLIPEIQFYAELFGKYNDHQGVIYNTTTFDIYKVFDTNEKCYTSDIPKIEKKNFISANPGIANEVGSRCALSNRFHDAIPTFKYYKNYVANRLQEKNLPTSLQYLPFLESMWDPVVISRAGAVGTWQLMPAAATANGLRVDPSFIWAKSKRRRKVKKKLTAYIDERRDPIKATDAAANYFLNAYAEIEKACGPNAVYDTVKSSCVVVTSYNHGINGMERAVKVFGLDYMKIRTDYKSKLFGPDGKGYFVKFLAVYHVATHEEEYFHEDILPLQLPVTWTVTLDRSMYAREVASRYSIPIDQLRSVNLRYTENIWQNDYKIPANYTLEIPKNVF